LSAMTPQQLVNLLKFLQSLKGQAGRAR